MRAEIEAVVGEEPVCFEHVKSLRLLRNVFREALRLYPPITFIPRVAAEATRIGEFRIKKGAMIMVSPWTAHRNRLLWKDAEYFDPDRFDRGHDDDDGRGAFMSFGLGPRVCVGAAFATVESGLILARLVRRYDFETLDADSVRPVARLTTRPAREVRCRVRLRAPARDRGVR